MIAMYNELMVIVYANLDYRLYMHASSARAHSCLRTFAPSILIPAPSLANLLQVTPGQILELPF